MQPTCKLLFRVQRAVLGRVLHIDPGHADSDLLSVGGSVLAGHITNSPAIAVMAMGFNGCLLTKAQV